MIVAYSRGGGRWPPDNERLEVEEDGSFGMWRSVTFGTPAGRFGGLLSSRDAQRLTEEAQAATGSGDLELIPEEDSAIETIEVDSVRATMGHHDEPEKPWGRLVRHLRDLLDRLTDQPRAALKLEVVEGGRAARLAHLGEEAIRLDLSAFELRARLLDEGVVDEWRASQNDVAVISSRGTVDAGPGWALDLPFEHAFDLRKGRRVRASALLTAYDGDRPATVAVSSAAVDSAG